MVYFAFAEIGFSQLFSLTKDHRRRQTSLRTDRKIANDYPHGFARRVFILENAGTRRSSKGKRGWSVEHARACVRACVCVKANREDTYEHERTREIRCMYVSMYVCTRVDTWGNSTGRKHRSIKSFSSLPFEGLRTCVTSVLKRGKSHAMRSWIRYIYLQLLSVSMNEGSIGSDKRIPRSTTLRRSVRCKSFTAM